MSQRQAGLSKALLEGCGSDGCLQLHVQGSLRPALQQHCCPMSLPSLTHLLLPSAAMFGACCVRACGIAAASAAAARRSRPPCRGSAAAAPAAFRGASQLRLPAAQRTSNPRSSPAVVVAASAPAGEASPAPAKPAAAVFDEAAAAAEHLKLAGAAAVCAALLVAAVRAGSLAASLVVLPAALVMWWKLCVNLMQQITGAELNRLVGMQVSWAGGTGWPWLWVGCGLKDASQQRHRIAADSSACQLPTKGPGAAGWPLHPGSPLAALASFPSSCRPDNRGMNWHGSWTRRRGSS